MTQTTWTLRDVTFRHDGAAVDAVDRVSLDVAPGKMTALIGPNGAGKSTIVQLMLGMAAPRAGTVSLEGKSIGEWDRLELARRIAVVPQTEADALFSVREIVAMGRYPYLGAWQREGERDVAAIDAAMRRCDVTEFAARWIGTLSGGERQRVRVARALAQETSVLVLDEPTSSLDVRHEMQTFELLRTHRDEGNTVVIVTHHVNLASRYADTVVLMHHGALVAAGSPTDVVTAERMSAVYGWPIAVDCDVDGAPRITPLPLRARGAA